MDPSGLKHFTLTLTEPESDDNDSAGRGQPMADGSVELELHDITASLGETMLDVQDISEENLAIAQCDISLLNTTSFENFPSRLMLRMNSSDGFGTFLFNDVDVFRNQQGTLSADFHCHQPNKYWEGTWGLAKLLAAIRDQVTHRAGISVIDIELDDDWKRLTLRLPLAEESASSALQASAATLQSLIREAEIALGGMRWKSDYATDERAFCEEILAPLLRRMGFTSVKYTQGPREFGRDFTFSERTFFGFLRHYGLQAKAGDVRGNVNSAIDELIGQADDAFKIPYIDIGSNEPRYISTFIIAISGRFTDNAKAKIANKIPRGLHGSILFLDRESLLELIERYWRTS